MEWDTEWSLCLNLDIVYHTGRFVWPDTQRRLGDGLSSIGLELICPGVLNVISLPERLVAECIWADSNDSDNEVRLP